VLRRLVGVIRANGGRRRRGGSKSRKSGSLRETIERRRLDPAKNLRPSLSSLTLIPRNRGGEGILKRAKRKTARKRNVNPAERRHRTNPLLLATYALKPMIAFERNHLEGHLRLHITKVDQVQVRRQQQLLQVRRVQVRPGGRAQARQRRRDLGNTRPCFHRVFKIGQTSSRIYRSYTPWKVD
jgi:hypothetical protein